MRPTIGGLAFAAAGFISLAFADPPAQAPAAAPPASAQPSTTSAAPAATVKPEADGKAQAAVQSTPDIDPREKLLLAEGYKPEMRNGQKVYCRREQVLGSRLGEEKHCGTIEQLGIRTQNSRDQTDLIQRTQVNPSAH